MLKPRLRFGTLIIVLASSGCAGLRVEPISDSRADEKARGFRYYESSPYLLVHTDNAGGLTSKILFLPDETKKRSARPYTFLASNTATLTFDRGVLASTVTDADSSVVPKALISALEKVAQSLISAASKAAVAANQPQKTVPAPYLFKIVIDGSNVTLMGGQPDGAETINFQQ